MNIALHGIEIALLITIFLELKKQTRKVIKTMAAIDDLQAQVAQNTDVEASAVTLIQGLAAQIADAGTDPAKLTALQTQLNASATDLAAAITANTPAAP